ncbi:hypothetical protein [Pseudoalteromonas luteoviolacea]|uniref:Lipoprotein n=1 Tax=Pseudoalteromonas luteoviolacea S4060-1 TaxID=1365257 RepID=A0A167NFG3_9GAMM|nr:hypothetical protein [Pseudoalteromonas luteoviolacea]KZN68157.1 hypothetical protein N478_16155 [Pseudoalteromonas luteoviolacea S4060-1]
MIQRYTLALTAILIVGCESKDSDKVEDLSTTSLSQEGFIISQFYTNRNNYQPYLQATIEGTVALEDNDGKLIKLTGADSLKLVATSGETYTFSNKQRSNLGATPEHCCVISTVLKEPLKAQDNFEVKLSRNESITSFGTVTFPQLVEFIYPSNEQDLAAITLDNDELTLSWQPQTDSDLKNIELSIQTPEQHRPCPARIHQRWFKSAQNGEKQQPEDKHYSELDHQLTLDLSKLAECEKPWRIYITFNYFNGQIGQQILDFTTPL